MSDAFLELPRASFVGIPFPVKKVVAKCGLRHHTHEYPKVPGGSPEKLGRKLYTFNITAVFDKNLLAPWNVNNLLWPNELVDLFEQFEQGVTSDLVVPTIGTIRAMCTSWQKEMDVKGMRSGEIVEMEFLEDQSSEFLVENLIQVRASTLAAQMDLLQQAAAAAGKASLFQQVLDMIATVQGYLNTAELMSSLLTAQVERLNFAMQRLDALTGLFDDSSNLVLLEAFLDTWLAIQRLLADLFRFQSIPVVDYYPPNTMSVYQVALAVYGSTDRAADVLQLNAVPNSLAIPQGTKLRVYANERVA
jgi:prophage DNA circulation protein